MKELIEIYPNSLCCAATPDGNLPLHLAVKFNRSTDIIRLILKAYPRAYAAKNLLGQTPVQCAQHIKDPVGKARFKLLEAFEEVEYNQVSKDMRKMQKELDEVKKKVDESLRELSKAQRELWYRKQFPIPSILSGSKVLAQWKNTMAR